MICNSRGTLARAAALAGSDDRMRVVHLGTDVPADDDLRPKHPRPTIATRRERRSAQAPRGRAARARRLPPQYRWMVIGDGPHLRRIERLAGELGLASRVVFAGRLSPRETHAELARSHVMALPSVDEAFGVAYVEALAHGVPAIGLRGRGRPGGDRGAGRRSGPDAARRRARPDRAAPRAIERAVGDAEPPRPARARTARRALHVGALWPSDRGGYEAALEAMKPVALVTGEVSPYRREPFRMLAEAEGVEVITFRGGPEPSAGRAGAAQAGSGATGSKPP